MALKRILKSLDGVAEAVAALYTKQADDTYLLEVEGVEDTTGLKATVKQLRTENDEFKKAMAKWEGFDPEQIKSLMVNSKDTEEQKLIKEGKFEEVVKRRTEALVADYEKKLKGAGDALTGEKSKGQKMHTKVLDAALSTAAAAVGVHKSALKDIMLQGRTVFSLNDDSDVVAVKDGSVVLGKDGKSPLQPSEWLESQREESSHWFPAGGGGSGSQSNSNRSSGGDGKKEMKRADFEALSPTDRVAKSKEGYKLID